MGSDMCLSLGPGRQSLACTQFAGNVNSGGGVKDGRAEMGWQVGQDVGG